MRGVREGSGARMKVMDDGEEGISKDENTHTIRDCWYPHAARIFIRIYTTASVEL